MLVLVVTMAVHPRCWTSCCFHLSSVMDLADNFNAFPTSEVKPSCPKSSFPGACEVVVTTKTRIHCRRALYYVIMLFNTWKLTVLTWLDILKATKHTRAPVSWSISRLGSNHCSNLGGHFFSTKLYTIRYKDYKNYVASKHDDGGEITNYVFFSDRILPNPAFWLATERSVTTYRCFYATITLDAMLTNIVRFIVRSVSKMSPGLPPRAIFETAGKYFYIRAYKQVNNIYGFKVPLMALCILHICNIFILMVTFVVYLVRPKIHLPELSCDQNWWFFPFWKSNRDEKSLDSNDGNDVKPHSQRKTMFISGECQRSLYSFYFIFFK